MELDHEVIIIGAGVCGIYQLHRLLELGVDATVIEAGDDLGGTWFWNRYPGARFDSESVSYGYSFSPELLQEWDWKERFSGQPENLRYLNFVADKFDLRPHMQFGCAVESAVWDEDGHLLDAAPRRRPRPDVPLRDHGDRHPVRADAGRATRAWTTSAAVRSTPTTGPTTPATCPDCASASSAPAPPACRSSARWPIRSAS